MGIDALLQRPGEGRSDFAMTGYPEPIARPIGALHFELMISFLNPGRDPLTAIWHVRLPPGIEEEQGRRTLIGGTVVPARRKAEAST